MISFWLHHCYAQFFFYCITINKILISWKGYVTLKRYQHIAHAALQVTSGWLLRLLHYGQMEGISCKLTNRWTVNGSSWNKVLCHLPSLLFSSALPLCSISYFKYVLTGTPGYPTAGEWLLSVLNEDANVGSDPRYVAISKLTTPLI